jgi:eukaryotic-like serine/threonine-protein kinase
MGPCKVTVTNEPLGTLVTVSGVIDESAPFREVVRKLRPPVIVDLGAVKFVNSVGLREWIQFVREVPRPLTLRRCSESMVLQFNMVTDAVADARVESFIAPYVCDACGREESIEIQTRELREGSRTKLPARACGECGGKAEFAELGDRYLLFLDT